MYRIILFFLSPYIHYCSEYPSFETSIPDDSLKPFCKLSVSEILDLGIKLVDEDIPPTLYPEISIVKRTY
ncbi:MAG: hypothetical protein HEEMFOPI_00578 [Holosporales bacterium]